MQTKATGAIPEIGSIRTYDYDVVCGSSTDTTYPKQFCLPREVMGTLKNQGSIGACVAETIAAVAEELYRRRTGESVEMSEGQVYGGLRQSTERTPGMLVEQTLKLWMTMGVAPKSYLPELFEMPEIKHWVAKFPDIWEIAKQNTIGSYVALRGTAKNPRDLQIKDALTKYPYGLIAVSHDYFGGCHCITLVGWDDDKDTYTIKNSWGPTYGNEGIADIPKSAINAVYLVLENEVKLPYTDLDENAWYFKSLKNVIAAGLMKGTSETTFEPNKTMTRAEVGVLIDRVLAEQQKTTEHLLKMIAEREIKEQN